MMRAWLAVPLLFAGAAFAQDVPMPAFPATGADSGAFVPEGMRIEALMSADFDADGAMDLALVLRDDDHRVLLVAMAQKGGFRRIGVGELDPGPLGDASLSAPKGVLVIADLTGGTSAVESTYRYRYEKATDRMRLIGDDVSYYSRTWQHGTTSVSTNRLNGKRITTVNDLVGEPGENAELGPDRVTNSTVPTEPKIYLGEAPTPEDTLGMGE